MMTTTDRRLRMWQAGVDGRAGKLERSYVWGWPAGRPLVNPHQEAEAQKQARRRVGRPVDA